MKILYIAFAQSIHTIKWVDYFKQNNNVLLISFYPSGNINGVDIRYIPVKNKNLAIMKIGEVKKIIDEFNPDILHAHYASSCGLIAALANFHPYVLSVWGDDILNFPNKSPLHKWVVKKAIRDADYVTATSQMLADSTNELINDDLDISVIPFGVDLDQYKVVDREKSDIIEIGTVRNLTPKYGIEYLIRAVANCLSQNYNIKLTIVGDGDIKNELESLSNKLNISSSVTFTGAIPNEKVVEYLHCFDIFAMPSVGKGETFGVAAVEAMATGLPVVASRVGGLPEVVDDGITGTLVEPGNVEQLTAALIKYIESEELRKKHGENGRMKVERDYNWQENTEKMNMLYTSLKSSKL